MSILELPKGKKVMEYGEVGENFYFILQGEVEIEIPDPNRKKAFLNRLAELEEKKEELNAIIKNIERYNKTKDAL
jgi:hypothetical protein